MVDLFPTFEVLAGNKVVSTVIIILAAITVRIGVERYLNVRTDIEGDHRRRILSNLRNALFFILLIGVALIWAPALRTFALSLTAFIVALIIATKELILCISGSVLKTASGTMKVGNWIEVNGLRGEVVDQTLMSTTLQELGKEGAAYEFTGRTVVIPNSIFLNVPVTNEQFFKRYIFHTFHLVVDPLTDIVPVESKMLEVLKAEMTDQIDVARRYNAKIEKKAGINILDPEPRSRVSTMNDGKVKLSVTAFLPTHQATEIEQKALRAGLAVVRDQSLAREPKK